MIDIPFSAKVWESVAEHYFDHVHWSNEFPGLTLDTWVQRQYGATLDVDRRWIRFETDAKRNWFILRWGQ